MKKIIKIGTMLVCATLILLSLENNAYASTAGSMKNKADEWINQGSQNPPITTDEVWGKLLPIGQVLISIGSVVLVGCFMYLGVKYMLTDPSGKADIKQKLIGLVIATVVIYGGIGIFTILVNLMNNLLR